MIENKELYEKHSQLFIDYIGKKNIELGKDVLKCKRIYLDKCYWIFLREVFLRRSNNRIHIELYKILDELLKYNKIICPISEIVIIELLKQSDSITRNATIKIIDNLSKGIAIRSFLDRINIEIKHFLLSEGFRYPLKQIVWESVSHTILENLCQKYFEKSSLEDMLGSRQDTAVNVDFSELVEELTQGKFEHEKELKNFNDLFLSELQGGLKTIKTSFKIPDSVIRLIYSAFRSDKITIEMPSLRILAGIHAIMRWDRKRKFKENDILDFHHAASCLPYCNFFLTERPLKDLLSNKLLSFDKLYNTIVISDAKEAVQCLSSL